MPFDSPGGTESQEGKDHPPLLGILTQRPWRQVVLPTTQVMERLRREFPIDIPVSPQLLTILASRGFADASSLERYFYPSLEQLNDPFELIEMDQAVSRLCRAVRDEEKVAVHGDFDVDGMTGCTLLSELLGELHLDGHRIAGQMPFIPDRARDGYGVAGRMIRHWVDSGVTLLITVDTGASAHEEISRATELGLDVIVLDHHIYTQRPPALAVVNPWRPEAEYPHGDLCGVAVAFKLVQAIRQAEPACLPADFENSVLDLVALGLVADQMPLVDENRVLVRRGLSCLADRQQRRPGLSALITVAGLDHGFPVTTSDLAYQIAPRLNACGRIGRVATALELLLTRDPTRARDLAQEADLTNQRRKQEDQALKEEAIREAQPYLERGDRGLALASTDWHKGIIGIGAARLVEQFQVPAVLFAIEGEEARGSARSVANVDIKAVLDECGDLLIRYGGHAQAAGMTLRTSDIAAFRSTFLAALASCPAGGPVPEDYDLDLPLTEMTAGEVANLMNELEYLEPYGVGNRRPVFRCRNLRLLRPPTALGNGTHLRFAFNSPGVAIANGSPALGREFVSFGTGTAWQRLLDENPGQEAALLRQSWDILFQLNRSTFRPRSGSYDPVQQQLLDIKPAVES